MSDSERIEQLRQTIQEEEKRFLMDRYVAMLMAQVEEAGEEELDDRMVESLLVSRSYVSDDLSTRVADLLENAGYEVEDVEQEDDDETDDASIDATADPASGNGHAAEMDAAEDFDTAVEDEDFAALLDGEDVSDAGDADDGGPPVDPDDPDFAGEASADTQADSLDADDSPADTDEVPDAEVDTAGLFDEEDGDPAAVPADDAGSDLFGTSADVDLSQEEAGADAGSVADLGDLDGEGLFDDGADAADGELEDVASEDEADIDADLADAADDDDAQDVGLFDEEGEATASEAGKKKGRKRAEKESADDADEDGTSDEEDESAGVLFDHDIYSGNEGPGDGAEAIAGDGAAPGASGEAVETPGFEPSQGHSIEETPDFTATVGHEVEETPGFTPSEGHEVEETPGFTPTEGDQVEGTPGFTPTEGHEVEETPGFTPTEGHDVEETPGFTPTQGHEVEETPGFTPTEGHDLEETPGFTPTEGHDLEETPGFTPTEGHEVGETPSFTPAQGHEVEETPGFTSTKGHEEAGRTAGFTPVDGGDLEDTPGFNPVDGGETEDTPGFTPTKGHEVEETPGFTPTKGHDARRKKAGPGFTVDGETEPESTIGKRPVTEGLTEEAEQDSKKRPKGGKAAEEEEEEEAEELDLDSLTHQISLDDIEQYLGMSVLPDDRQKLDRRWQQKIRDPSIRALLASETAMQHPYALVPRLPRFFKGGAAVQANMLNLVRNYPQLFDNVAGLINKYRTEAFFVGETPELDWAIVACEALPNSLNRNYMEQKTVVKQYAQQNHTNERRIQRRRLIEILYDCIVINVITKEQILDKTVDLSDSRVGRQNFACVNYGDKGIRINDVSRQQRHPQMGLCPSW